MLSKQTLAIVTMVAMGTLWMLGEMVAMGDTIFQNTCFQNFLVFFFVRALTIKVQSNKKCVSTKATIKIHFPLLWQLCFYLRMKIKE